MNLSYKYLVLVLFSSFAGLLAKAQDWPKQMSTSNGDIIKIYQPQPESFNNNVLSFRSALSYIERGKTEPVFGVVWGTANTSTNYNRTVSIQSLTINHIKFPNDVDNGTVNNIRTTLEQQAPRANISFSQDELQNSLQQNQEEVNLSNNINTAPPKITYTTTPSTLVLIDGEPKLQYNNNWEVEAVVNTPFTIVKNNDGKFYLYGGGNWYTASAATGPFTYTDRIPKKLSAVQKAVQEAEENNNNNAANDDDDNNDVIPQIIVSTSPAELIQSNGEANFSPVQGTNLLYVQNSSNDIFMDVNAQQYYVLLSGRWYKSSNLKGDWNFVAADKLPADFAKIPAGSPKDNVLASVAGTPEASTAVMNAQIPQTAKVDRRNASLNITYDGDPTFEKVQGTKMSYAVNTSSTVLKMNNTFYAVDNGVWFQSNYPDGPWEVSTVRPDEVDRIPPSSPVYNAKYVYIYDVTPDFVYMGYTPGYLNNFIFGPTIVYGTGFYYRPWYHRYYYPRAYTWGFHMNYNPWFGWSLGFGFHTGWFNMGIGGFGPYYWGGGWWGPPVYRPAYCRPSHYYGYYGNRSYINNRVNVVNINYTNNIYRNRRDVVSYNRPEYVNRNYNRPVTRPDRGGFNNNNSNSNRPITRPDRWNNNNNGTVRPDGRPQRPGSDTRPSTRPSRPVPNNNQGDRPQTRPFPGSDRPARPNRVITQPSNDRPNRVISQPPSSTKRPNRVIPQPTSSTNRPSRPNRAIPEQRRMEQQRPMRQSEHRNVSPSNRRNDGGGMQQRPQNSNRREGGSEGRVRRAV